MFAIYGLLAVPFKSYTLPIIIMLAIPLGFVSAVAGHVALGYELSIISMFGVIALAGVAVNDPSCSSTRRTRSARRAWARSRRSRRRRSVDFGRS
jgi:Cu/Ag efflux pump CusA